MTERKDYGWLFCREDECQCWTAEDAATGEHGAVMFAMRPRQMAPGRYRIMIDFTNSPDGPVWAIRVNDYLWERFDEAGAVIGRCDKEDWLRNAGLFPPESA